MLDTPDRDLEVFNLRREGRSFGGIARELRYDNSQAVTHAFFRALTTCEPPLRELVRLEEHGRLDALAEHVLADETLDQLTRERRLGVVDRLRTRVNAACEAAAEAPPVQA